jgi:type III secretory pathway component EscS
MFPLFSKTVALAGVFNMVVFVGLTAITILQLVTAMRNKTLPHKIK